MNSSIKIGQLRGGRQPIVVTLENHFAIASNLSSSRVDWEGCLVCYCFPAQLSALQLPSPFMG